MTLQAWCIACQYGHHERHNDVPRPGVSGLIGSRHECPCRGECQPSAPPDDPERDVPVGEPLTLGDEAAA